MDFTKFGDEATRKRKTLSFGDNGSQDAKAGKGFGWYDECPSILDAEWDGLN